MSCIVKITIFVSYKEMLSAPPHPQSFYILIINSDNAFSNIFMHFLFSSSYKLSIMSVLSRCIDACKTCDRYIVRRKYFCIYFYTLTNTHNLTVSNGMLHFRPFSLSWIELQYVCAVFERKNLLSF